MLTVAYLANQFPSPVEPYVGDEIEELRRRGLRIIAGSVRKAARRNRDGARSPGNSAEVVLQPLRIIVLFRAAWLCVCRWRQISDLVWPLIWSGSQGLAPRVKALLHTWLGACYAVMLRGRDVNHIHVHHGYFGSWIAMTAARMLNVGFSMTLHGSDLLLRSAYLDVKLANCLFCLTVSEYNRRFILDHYPEVEPAKVVVSRLGVEMPDCAPTAHHGERFTLLAVGRLHAVKDHAFLVRACAQLAADGMQFECSIAGEGPERRRLQSMITKFGLEQRVTLLGHVAHEQMCSLYDRADVVVLTSRSEGIPLVLMEAMARGKIVLAPAITGIPELVLAGKTGFLYDAGSLDDFLAQLMFIYSETQASSQRNPSSGIPSAARQLDWVRHAARLQVGHSFSHDKNLESFGDLFIRRIDPQTESALRENFVLQQIQLPLQRHRSLPVRTDGADALAGARGSAVFDG
ncbi:MAG TPA: glycosyltransferase [Terriglobales bacterium]|nr:glycosyltransferase [Terriglobales bacterium]